MALRSGASMSRKLSRKAATDKNTSTPVINSTQRMVLRALHSHAAHCFGGGSGCLGELALRALGRDRFG